MEGASSGEAEPDEAFRDADTGEVWQESVQMAKFIKVQKANQELREELQRARDDYNMATGTISSLQRQLEIQESQLRRIKSEKEMLQRKLREQEKELETLCAKFRSLREEQEHVVMMATMEENSSLQQVVTELKSTVAEQKEQMSELRGVVSQLRAELQSCQRHSHAQQQEQAALQRQAEILQHKVLQATVALESISSRFERYRNKIIQATFSTAGSKPPQAELTDEEVLEAMQKIINERMEYYQMLKQKGIKVPSPYSMDRSASPIGTKGKRKSPAKQHLANA